ncbi:MAG: ABC transporter permease [Geminicoccaceae bacterium]|nr:ABC transporter permease [Geminicoccaceae bacterium]MDW8371401.1 ABC transporter permease [Geminicoccaceae bacterium]
MGRLVLRPEAGSALGLLAVFAIFAWFGGANFLSAGGVASWLNVAAGLGIVALPIGLLMIAGHLDLSIGSIIPAASITTAIIAGLFGAPIALGIAAALGVGLLVGFVNGLLVVRTRLPSFVVTLATLFAVAGLTLGLSILVAGSTSVALRTEGFAKAALGQFLGGRFQVTVLWWLLAVLVAWLVLHHTRYGNWIFAMGGDAESARACGVPTERLTIALYMASGAAAAFVGLSQAILYNSAQVSAGQSFVFNSIIAVVIGGVLLTGGFGSVLGIVLGTVTFAIVNQGIYFTGLDANWASLIIGVLLLLAVLTNNAFRKLALAYSARREGDRG